MTYFALSDRRFLLLSALLAGSTVLRCLSLCRMAQTGSYETVEGVCIEIGRVGLRRQRCVRLLQYDGNECALKLDKRTRLRMGSCYRVYFRRGEGNSSLFGDLLAGDLFLGLEDLGEYGHDK